MDGLPSSKEVFTGDISVSKKDFDTDIAFDMVLDGNDLDRDKTIVTATLLSIFTDGTQKQIGTQIDGKIYGNQSYNLDKLSNENIKAYKTGLENCLQWLIDDEIVSTIDIETENNGNYIGVAITFDINERNSTNIIYNLDTNYEFLD